MKLLSIGNSFSRDAHHFLSTLAKVNGFEIDTVNLYIGGCSLETHWKNLTGDRAAYTVDRNGVLYGGEHSILQVMGEEKWDVITLQQASPVSGRFESYEPYLTSLAKFVRCSQGQAKLYFHQTWAYETDCVRPGFANYQNSQREMISCIRRASSVAAKFIGADLIPSGNVIQAIRERVPEFDYEAGGLSLCRDGLHLSLDYGRFAAAATWLRTLTGAVVKVDTLGEMDGELLQKILAVVNDF